jgi:muramoyltetrapeptide carboxypeptidase
MDVPTRWRVLGNERDLTVAGRLIGGCADVLSRLIGTPYAELERFAREQAPEGLIVYLENCEMQPLDAARCWHQFKLAGWFRNANAVFIGRSSAPSGDRYSQHQAIADALGDLDIPVIYDADFGHQPPQMLIVNGAAARLRYVAGGRGDLTQRLS